MFASSTGVCRIVLREIRCGARIQVQTHNGISSGLDRRLAFSFATLLSEWPVEMCSGVVHLKKAWMLGCHRPSIFFSNNIQRSITLQIKLDHQKVYLPQQTFTGLHCCCCAPSTSVIHNCTYTPRGEMCLPGSSIYTCCACLCVCSGRQPSG